MADRQKLIDELLWNGGGDGWGLCAFGNMLAAMCGPRTAIKSVVLIGTDTSPGDGFTDDELQALAKISRDKTDYIVKRLGGPILDSDNLITIRKSGDKWRYSRRTWDYPAHCDTLEELHERVMKN